MEVADVRKRRSANFTANECLILSIVMGQTEDGFSKLTNYQLCRHKFTSNITSQTKKQNWKKIQENYDSMADVPLGVDELMKKWDNLVQTHRSKFFDHQRAQSLTGGGPKPTALSEVTDAVMDVVGRRGANVVGVGDCDNDSSHIMLERAILGQSDSRKMTADEEIISEIQISGTDHVSSEANVTYIPLPGPVSSNNCTKCHCTDCIDMRRLKRQKLKLQIKYFSNVEQ